jgi:hypothetical protein
MINKDLLKQLIIEEKKKYRMNLVEQAPAAPAPAAAPAGTPPAAPAAGGKPATGQAAPAALNMADADVKAAVEAWGMMLKKTKSPTFAKLQQFFQANKVTIP